MYIQLYKPYRKLSIMLTRQQEAKINAYPQHTKFHPKAADTDKMFVPRSISFFYAAASKVRLVVAQQNQDHTPLHLVAGY